MTREEEARKKLEAILEEATEYENAVCYVTGEDAKALEMAIKALELVIPISEIPKDYKYDTETKDFLVYRNMYTGDEMHIERPTPVYRLEQESYDDCISRRAVKEQMTKYGFHAPDMTVTEFVEDILPATPKKMGRWIECMPSGAEEWCYKCSECNFWKYTKTINLSKFKYCPDCGAKMESEEV